ncbi:putative uncharacterized protein ASB16-AS1 [Elephas maximus indicus]|uniref:putative uncharacterized protein ASB16-AS1 n=1 Tax=Elephas maximus indicus TaxID=99487 RepID=UPI002116E5B5|nr:putative uncharacterized protein ASB16-AS1 [Elephas maximus indicus]
MREKEHPPSPPPPPPSTPPPRPFGMRGAGLARDSWSNPEKPIRRRPSTSPPPAGLAQTPTGGGRAGGEARGAGGRACVRARLRACVRGPGAWRVGVCVRVCPCVFTRGRAREGACARVCAPGRSARSAIDYRTSAAPAAPRRAHSLAPTRAPGRVAPLPAAPGPRTPPPRGDQVTSVPARLGDPSALLPSHNKSHVFCRLERKGWNGEGRLISAA